MSSLNPPPKIKPRGPYSNGIRRGAVGVIDGRSREGRFLRACGASFVDQLGHEATFAELMLIRRVARSLLQLEKLDEKMEAGTWTELDSHVQGGLHSTVRLGLREIGLETAKSKRQILAAYLAAEQ